MARSAAAIAADATRDVHLIKLSEPQAQLLRWLVSRGGPVAAYWARTVAVLERYKLVKPGGQVDYYQVTDRGHRWVGLWPMSADPFGDKAAASAAAGIVELVDDDAFDPDRPAWDQQAEVPSSDVGGSAWGDWEDDQAERPGFFRETVNHYTGVYLVRGIGGAWTVQVAAGWSVSVGTGEPGPARVYRYEIDDASDDCAKAIAMGFVSAIAFMFEAPE